MFQTQYELINESLSYIKKQTGKSPQIGVVLGTGWQRFTEALKSQYSIDYKDVPNFATPSVDGHEGKLIAGEYGNLDIICLKGRLHTYEGLTIEEVVLPIRTICKLGISILIVTNSAGGVNPYFLQGDYMLISDHINMMGENPLKGRYDPGIGSRFVDMSEPYDNELIAAAEKCLKGSNINITSGIYAGVSGPSYETPSEIKMLGLLGADAVGMSTVPEVIAARQIGTRVIGISCITNMAAGIKKEEISHEKILMFMKANEEKSITILREIIPKFSLYI